MITELNISDYESSFNKIVFVLFSITGISSISYLLIWIRLFQNLFGITINTSINIVSISILGMALGGYWGGKYVDIKRDELRKFMYLEFATVIFVLLLYYFFNVIAGGYKFIVQSIFQHNLLIQIINFLLSSILFLPLATVIGAKFSILGRYIIRSENYVVKDIGMLHSSYVLGIIIGNISFLVLNLIFSIKLIVFLTLLIELIVAMATRFLLFRFSNAPNVIAEFYDQQLKYFSDANKHLTSTQINFTLIANGITSFIIASFIVLLVQNIFYFPQTNFYVHVIIFTIAFLSFVTGSYVTAKFIREDRDLYFKFSFFQFIMGILILIALIYLPKIIALNQKLWFNQYQNENYFSYWDVIFLMTIPLILMGVLFPIMFKIYLIKFERIGHRIGNFYATYFLGLALGILATYYLLIPMIGMVKSIITLAGCNFIVFLVVLIRTSNISLKYKLIISIPVVLFIFSFYLFFPDFYNFGNHQDEIIRAQEGNHVIYSATRDKTANVSFLKINGSILEGTNLQFSLSQRLIAHIPLLLNDNPQKVFINGFGIGEIPRIVLNYQVDKIDCAETSPEIITLASYFSSVNHNIIHEPHFNLILLDGTAYLYSTKHKYDVIINNYFQPEFYKNYFYYTKEFFQNCYNHLNAGGIVAIKLSLQNISFEKFQVILNTFNSVFKNTSLWFNNNGVNYYLLLVGSNKETFEIDFNRMNKKIQSDVIAMNLAEVGLNSIYEILDCYICGPNSFNQIIKKTTINSFDHPYFSFTRETKADQNIRLSHFLQLFKRIKEPVTYLLEDLETSDDNEDLIKVILDMYYKSSNYILEGLICEFNDDQGVALLNYRLGYQINKLDYGANRFIDDYYDPQLIPEPHTPAEFTENAKIYYQKMEYQKAISMLQEALKIDDNYAPAYFGLGINYEVLYDINMAKKMYRKTVKLKPKLTQAQERLDNLIRKEKELEESLKRGLFNKK